MRKLRQKVLAFKSSKGQCAELLAFALLSVGVWRRFRRQLIAAWLHMKHITAHVRVVSLTLYPVQGCQGHSVQSVRIDADGLVDNQSYVIVNSSRKCLSRVEIPELAQIQPVLTTEFGQDPSIAQSIGNWDPSQSHEVGPKVVSFATATTLTDDQATGVSQAVEKLNSGEISCPEGYCLVHSVNRNTHFFLWRDDKADFVCKKFRVHTESHLAESDSHAHNHEPGLWLRLAGDGSQGPPPLFVPKVLKAGRDTVAYEVEISDKRVSVIDQGDDAAKWLQRVASQNNLRLARLETTGAASRSGIVMTSQASMEAVQARAGGGEFGRNHLLAHIQIGDCKAFEEDNMTSLNVSGSGLTLQLREPCEQRESDTTDEAFRNLRKFRSGRLLSMDHGPHRSSFVAHVDKVFFGHIVVKTSRGSADLTVGDGADVEY